MVFCGKMAYLQTHTKSESWGCFGKFMILATLWHYGTANPPSKNRQNSLLTIYTPLKSCPFMTCNENLFHMLVEGKIKVFLYPWPDMSSLTLVP